MFARFSATALNHLLAQNSWALPRLQKFAGKTARFNIAPFSFGYTIVADGFVCSAEAAISADAQCTISPALLPRLAVHDEQALGEIQNEGDAALLTEIFFLAKNLRWDAAEDLSKITGDVMAERVMQAARITRQQLHTAANNLAQAAAEYWTEERPLIATPPRLAAFMQQVDTLRDDLARLEQRIARLG